MAHVPILRIDDKSRKRIQDTVVQEYRLTIVVNNHELVSLLCSPAQQEFLAVGFLLSEGLIKGREDVKNMILDEEKDTIMVEANVSGELPRDILSRRLIASSGAKGTSPDMALSDQPKIYSRVEVSPAEVFSLVEEFVHRSQVFQATGGVHSAALCDPTGILLFAEDIGRHNAIDKIFGQCLLEGIPTDDRLVLTSGRVSSEILLKVAKRGVPLLISKSAPTDVGVKLATDLGITLIGFVRGKKMNVYAHDWRVLPQ